MDLAVAMAVPQPVKTVYIAAAQETLHIQAAVVLKMPVVLPVATGVALRLVPPVKVETAIFTAAAAAAVFTAAVALAMAAAAAVQTMPTPTSVPALLIPAVHVKVTDA
jgi:hypothetical protein